MRKSASLLATRFYKIVMLTAKCEFLQWLEAYESLHYKIGIYKNAHFVLSGVGNWQRTGSKDGSRNNL